MIYTGIGTHYYFRLFIFYNILLTILYINICTTVAVGRVVFWVPPKTPNCHFVRFGGHPYRPSTLPSITVAFAMRQLHVAVVRCLINCRDPR